MDVASERQTTPEEMRHRLALLAKAIAPVEALLERMDTEREVCPCCQLGRYPNWSDASDAQTIGAVLNRLQRLEGAYRSRLSQRS